MWEGRGGVKSRRGLTCPQGNDGILYGWVSDHSYPTDVLCTTA